MIEEVNIVDCKIYFKLGSVFMLMHFKTFICRHYLCVTTIFNKLVCWKCLGNEENVTVHYRWFVYLGASNMSLLYCNSLSSLLNISTYGEIYSEICVPFIRVWSQMKLLEAHVYHKQVLNREFYILLFLEWMHLAFCERKTKINKHTKF